MSTNDFTTPDIGANLNERELFQQFIKRPFKLFSNFGNLLMEREAELMLREAGEFGTLGDLGNEIADIFQYDDRPESTLECIISDLREYALNLGLLAAAFSEFKNSPITIPNEPTLPEDHPVDVLEPDDNPTPEPACEDLAEADDNSIRGAA